MKKTILLFAVTGGAFVANACLETRTVLDPDHCNSNGGDIFCAELYPDGSLPFCRLGNEACTEAAGITDLDHDGCSAARPEDECYSACGDGKSILDDPSCEPNTTDASSSGTLPTDPTPGTSSSGDPTTETDTPTDTTDTDTTDGGCMGDEDCGGDTPFCRGELCVACDAIDGSDAACADLDPDAPVCNDGQCVQCTSDNASACTGNTPVCDTEANLCIPCNEHAQCPDSACHLDGPDVGGCFDQSDVQDIANAAQLDTALAALGADDQAVLVLASGTYNTSVDVASSAEVAIVGDGSPVITGDGGLNAIELIGDSITYFQGVEIANISGNGASCSGTAIWLDDTELRNNAQVGLDISGGCAAHLRRTVVRANGGGGVDQVGGELELVNSVVALNGASVSPFGGLSIDGTELLLTYSTVAGNDSQNTGMSIRCSGANSGDVRNSIVVGDEANSVDACAGLTFTNNGVDDTGLGAMNVNVGAFNPSWFVNPAMGDYSLSTAGETIFMDIAMWQDGDPITDVDGNPIPTDMPSFPGYHQP